MKFNLFEFTIKQQNLKSYKALRNFAMNFKREGFDYNVCNVLYINIWKKTIDNIPVIRYVIGDSNTIINNF